MFTEDQVAEMLESARREEIEMAREEVRSGTLFLHCMYKLSHLSFMSSVMSVRWGERESTLYPALYA